MREESKQLQPFKLPAHKERHVLNSSLQYPTSTSLRNRLTFPFNTRWKHGHISHTHTHLSCESVATNIIAALQKFVSFLTQVCSICKHLITVCRHGITEFIPPSISPVPQSTAAGHQTQPICHPRADDLIQPLLPNR